MGFCVALRDDCLMWHRRDGLGDDMRLTDFNTWRVEHPEIDDNIIRAVNDHRRRIVTVSWAGPMGPELARLEDEAERRGIELLIRRARYTKARLHDAAMAIFASEADLAIIHFGLDSVTTDPDPEGLRIEGFDLRCPESLGDEPLAEELVRAVRHIVLSLDKVRSTFLPEDIRIEAGRTWLA